MEIKEILEKALKDPAAEDIAAVEEFVQEHFNTDGSIAFNLEDLDHG